MTRRTLLWFIAPMLALVIVGLLGTLLFDPGAKPQGRRSNHDLRQVYSPSVLADPAFRKAQRHNLRALERACDERGEFCAEAHGAADALDREGAS